MWLAGAETTSSGAWMGENGRTRWLCTCCCLFLFDIWNPRILTAFPFFAPLVLLTISQCHSTPQRNDDKILLEVEPDMKHFWEAIPLVPPAFRGDPIYFSWTPSWGTAGGDDTGSAESILHLPLSDGSYSLVLQRIDCTVKPLLCVLLFANLFSCSNYIYSPTTRHSL